MANRQAIQDKLRELGEATHRADPTAFLVEPRVIRRLIREHFTFPFVFSRVPHSRVYVATYDELSQQVHPDELGLSNVRQMPPNAILIQEPSERQLEKLSDEELRLRTWRLLFHGKVDRAISKAMRDGRLSAAEVRRRIDELGQVSFDEIHTVLRREYLLLDPESSQLAWQEFAAVYFEFLFFAPRSVETWFPSLRDRELSNPLPEINAEILFAESRLVGSAKPAGMIDAEAEDAEAETLETIAVVKPARRKCKRLLRLADRASVNGNNVRAAICATRAAAFSTSENVESVRQLAIAEIDQLIERLRDALNFGDIDAAHWKAALTRILPHALKGYWNHDRKLLYDLQKVCSDHERLTYKVDLVKWAVSRGKRPIKRPLPNQREVMMSKHLRTAAGRLPFIHLSGLHREQLSTLLRSAAASAEKQMRQRMRPVLRDTLASVGFKPRNVPEQVAFDKIAEQGLDCIADRGYLTMGYLRDAISRNNLKLPDVSSIRQIIGGDRLLKADDELDVALDGVYHRGEFYLRWLQVVSSLGFGTDRGRFLTKYIAIPFGGAFLIVEGVKYLLSHLVAHQEYLTTTMTKAGEIRLAAKSVSGHSLPTTMSGWLSFMSPVLMLGFFLMAMIHVPRYREAAASVMRKAHKGLRWLLIDLPVRIFQIENIRRFLRSRFFRLLSRWLITPAALATLACYIMPWLIGVPPPNVFYVAATFALLSLFVNSRLGRDVEELTFEWFALRWYQLRAHVLVALFEWVWEAFEKLLELVERFLYAIDEWLRFRSGESAVVLGFKAVLGVVWSLIDFIIRFCVNLLIEPQVNPIKHFPVVTVSHKLLLPTVPAILGPVLNPLVGAETATAVAVLIATVIPGIFGFLVWELKENWRLYEANHSDKLKPVAVGSHGETMLKLLKPGFHSGTLPKLYHKLRRLDRKNASFRRSVRRQALYEQLHHCEEAIEHHVDRELFAYLRLTEEWKNETLRVHHVEATSNSISISLAWDAKPDEYLRLVFQEQSGWLVAGVQDPGWAKDLAGPQRDSFLAALFGFYKVGAVDMSREQIQYSLGRPDLAYDIADAGLKVWPDGTFREEFTYDLDAKPLLTPSPPGPALPSIKSNDLLLSQSTLRWRRWIDFWSSANGSRDLEQLLDGRVLVAELEDRD